MLETLIAFLLAFQIASWIFSFIFMYVGEWKPTKMKFMVTLIPCWWIIPVFKAICKTFEKFMLLP